MEEILNSIEEYIKKKEWQSLKQELVILEPVQIAEVIEEADEADAIVLFRLLKREQAKEVFQHLSHEQKEDIINALANNGNRIADLLNDLDPDDRTAFLEELPGKVSQRLMQMLSKEESRIAIQLLNYPEDSIGRMMTPEYVAVKPYFSVVQTLEHIRIFGRNSETLNVIYVVDEDWKLIDDIRINQIVLADPERKISEITDNRFISLNAYDNRETAVKVFQDYDRVALPVVDSTGVLLGIVTIDDVMDVVQEENTEDFQKFGGTEGLDVSYTKVSLFELVRKRAGWLVILFFSEMLTATALGHFDTEILNAVVLALFLPLIISSGGNSGSQAASLIIRSLALKELGPRNWWYVMRKEIFSGLMLGTLLGTIGFLRILFWQETGLYDYGEYWLWVALSIAVSLIFVVLWGTLSGSMIPLLMKRIGLDPAAASAPFVATLVDVTGLIIYFSVAKVLLAGKLL